ncbi:AsmA family protein, partial [Legionella sp.]|uniref:AsmA family protein n=1 Tax=Legionella sp. TaxID=459 RepID=UPI00321FE935
MKILKRLLAGIFVTLVITTLALWTLAKTIKPEMVKNYVSSQLSFLTQQESRIDGEISWQLFPRPAVKITQIQIGHEQAQENYSAKLENLLFNLKITPLLRGKLVFNELIVDGFKIVVNPEATSSRVKTVKLKETNEEKTSLADQFAIERFLLSHGQIIIQDNQKQINLSGLQIGAEQFNLQRMAFPLQFKTTLEVNAGQEKVLKTHINFRGRTSLSPVLFSNPLIALQNMPLDGQLSLQNTKLNHFRIAKISAHTKTKPGVLLLNPLTFDLYHGESVGDLHYEFASKKLILNQTGTNLDSAKLVHDLF